MQNELNLTPTQSIVLITVCLVILILLWHYDKPQNDTDTLLNTEPTETPKDYVKERYGAYLLLAGKKLGGEHGDIFY